MLASLSVCLADVLEVRGSNLNEDEAWLLLLEISKQLKDGLHKQGIITPYNVQINSTGSVSIDFSSRCPNNFEDFHQDRFSSENVLTCSFGMTILWCLQNGVPSNEYLTISNELQSTLAMLTSDKSTLESLEEAICLCDALEKKPSATDCFTKMYESILGREFMSRWVPLMRKSEIAVHQDQFDETPKLLKRSKKNLQVTSQHHGNNQHDSDSSSIAIMNNSTNEHMHESRKKVISETTLQQRSLSPDDVVSNGSDTLLGDAQVPETKFTQENPPPQRKPRSLSHIINQKVVLPKSMLKTRASPIQLNLCTDRSDFGKETRAVVVYIDSRRLIMTVNASKTPCGHLLSISASHLASAADCSLFGLAIHQDEEYIFVENSASLHKLSPIHGFSSTYHFYLRLKFLPQDQHLCDESLLQAMYLQIRKDVMEGRILCDHEQAMLLAAYSLQYELGDMTNLCGEYSIKDFLSPSAIAELGHPYVCRTLPRLHAKLEGTSVTSARDMYISKARQLGDFGNHFILVYMSQKCISSASCWLAIGPRGLRIFRMQQGNVRKIIHQYYWDKLKKISFKNTAVLLSTKDSIKLKFYVKTQRKSKYIVRMMGEMHQFHRFDDFENMDSFQCSNIPIAKPQRLILPFKRYQTTMPQRTMTQLVVNEPFVPNHAEKIPDPEECVEIPEIIPFVSNDESGELDNDEEHDMQESSEYRDSNKSLTIEHEKPANYETDFLSLHGDQQEETSTFDVNELPPPIMHEISGEFKVDLEKINGSFGFTILGGSDKQIGLIKVHQIVPDGAADRNGMLQCGDVILAINDLSLSNVTHKIAAETIGKAPLKSRLYIKRDAIIRIENLPSPRSQVGVASFINESVVEEDDSVFAESLNNSEDVVGHSSSNAIDSRDQPTAYDERVSQVASAFYNYQYTDIESEFQHQYIGSGAEDLSLKDGSHTVEEDASRGEGDGISNFSGPDHRTSTPQSIGLSDDSLRSRRCEVPDASAKTDFEDIRRRLSSLKTANESSSNSGENESWSTGHD